MNINPDDISFKLSDGFDNLKKFKGYNKQLFVIHADYHEPDTSFGVINSPVSWCSIEASLINAI